MNQICCLNPNCDNPSVPDTNRLCPKCQKPLVLLRHRYRPVKSLGQGGFGKTYLAMDNDKFGETCVIKQLAPQAGSTAAVQKAQQLFEQEARQLQNLQHPQIPDLKAYFSEGSYFYFVQDFIEGDNLLGELKRGIFDEQKTIKFLNELLPVLKYIHDRGIVHRDIKPENMMRQRSDGRLFLIDFGVSKQLQGTIYTGTSIGTFGYAPLEQMQDGKVYPASDLFSVGATCFHLLTGMHPWEVWRLKGYGWVQEWRQHLKKPVSSQFGTVLDKLLALYPEQRYQSAVDVLNAFNEEDTVVEVSYRGYVRRLPPKTAESRSRLSEDITVETEEDFPIATYRTTTAQQMVILNRMGKAYPLNVADIPGGSARSRGV
ncbi:protein kinase, partial [Lyngbya sp. CCY1209]|uniref:protein kinase domain-containing protein n=1 Tax=Lyngbya sp. CCY1209 TaxID=2886103 RepID=UPI002D208713